MNLKTLLGALLADDTRLQHFIHTHPQLAAALEQALQDDSVPDGAPVDDEDEIVFVPFLSEAEIRAQFGTSGGDIRGYDYDPDGRGIHRLAGREGDEIVCIPVLTPEQRDALLKKLDSVDKADTPPPSDTAFSDNEAETAAIPPAATSDSTPVTEKPLESPAVTATAPTANHGAPSDGIAFFDSEETRIATPPEPPAENPPSPPDTADTADAKSPTIPADKPEPAMPLPSHTPTPAPAQPPRISLSPLPPANEGQHYERELSPDAPVLNIAFAQECGLAWDGETRRIHGTPTISGNVQLIITISHDGKPLDIKQPLHINPDPKSLWQDLPSDQTAPFAKPDSAEDLQDTALGRLLAARVRGRSHAHVGSYCDDDYRLASHDASGVHLIIVADGAGSASHARYGSQLAVNAAADTILALLDDPGKPHHKLAHADSATRKQIADNLIANALHAAVSAHKTTAQQAGIAEKALSCTLLIALTLPLADGSWYSAGYQVGDGAAALWHPENGALHLLGVADSGAYSGETQFLTAAQLQPDDIQRRIRTIETAAAPTVILMTDGVSDPKFETDAALGNPQRWQALWDELQAPLAADDPKTALHEWLGFWSRGNHDDRTIAFFLPAAGETQT